MASLFTCSYSIYGCIESIILSLIGLFTIFVFVKGLKNILKDNNQVIGEIDRYTYYLALGQVILVVAFLTAFPNNLIYFSTRALRLVNEILICTVFV